MNIQNHVWLCCVCFGVFKKCFQKLPCCSLFLLRFLFLVVLGPFLLYKEFDDRYPKRPESVSKKPISDHIYQLIYIGLWFYDLKFAYRYSSKMATFRPKMRNLRHNAFLLELKPCKWLTLTMDSSSSLLKSIITSWVSDYQLL